MIDVKLLFFKSKQNSYVIVFYHHCRPTNMIIIVVQNKIGYIKNIIYKYAHSLSIIRYYNTYAMQQVVWLLHAC